MTASINGFGVTSTDQDKMLNMEYVGVSSHQPSVIVLNQTSSSTSMDPLASIVTPTITGEISDTKSDLANGTDTNARISVSDLNNYLFAPGYYH